jgi:hypothetical protein
MLETEDLRIILNRLYECRNLEISNLWQRSVFLSVFLILCFTAYGYIALNLLDKSIENNAIEYLFLINTIALCLASIGAIFSIIWILMGKGSKGWYEVYETAISNFEREYQKKLKLPEKYIMGEMLLPKDKKNKNIFSPKAGPFSPSKINILIGQMSLYIWILLIVIHSLYSFSSLCYHSCVICKLFITLIPVLLSFIIPFYIKKHVKSSFLTLPKS